MKGISINLKQNIGTEKGINSAKTYLNLRSLVYANVAGCPKRFCRRRSSKIFYTLTKKPFRGVLGKKCSENM